MNQKKNAKLRNLTAPCVTITSVDNLTESFNTAPTNYDLPVMRALIFLVSISLVHFAQGIPQRSTTAAAINNVKPLELDTFKSQWLYHSQSHQQKQQDSITSDNGSGLEHKRFYESQDSRDRKASKTPRDEGSACQSVTDCSCGPDQEPSCDTDKGQCSCRIVPKPDAPWTCQQGEDCPCQSGHEGLCMDDQCFCEPNTAQNCLHNENCACEFGHNSLCVNGQCFCKLDDEVGTHDNTCQQNSDCSCEGNEIEICSNGSCDCTPKLGGRPTGQSCNSVDTCKCDKVTEKAYCPINTHLCLCSPRNAPLRQTCIDVRLCECHEGEKAACENGFCRCDIS